MSFKAKSGKKICIVRKRKDITKCQKQLRKEATKFLKKKNDKK